MKRVVVVGTAVLSLAIGSIVASAPAQADTTQFIACLNAKNVKLLHDVRIGPNESVQIRVPANSGPTICRTKGAGWVDQILPRFDVKSSTGYAWPTGDDRIIIAGIYTLTPKPGAPFTTSMLKTHFGSLSDTFTITVVDPNNPDQPANPVDPDPQEDPDDGAAISDGSSSSDASSSAGAKKQQVLKRKLVLPSRVKVGVPTTLVPGAMTTNAGNTAAVKVICVAKDPKESGAPCLIVHGNNGAIGVNVKRPGTHVIVRFTAPGTKSFAPLEVEKYTRSKK